MADEPKIVEASGTAAGSKVTALGLEKAMADAIQQAIDEGVTDPDEIRKRQLAAREAFKKNEQSS